MKKYESKIEELERAYEKAKKPWKKDSIRKLINKLKYMQDGNYLDLTKNLGEPEINSEQQEERKYSDTWSSPSSEKDIMDSYNEYKESLQFSKNYSELTRRLRNINFGLFRPKVALSKKELYKIGKKVPHIFDIDFSNVLYEKGYDGADFNYKLAVNELNERITQYNNTKLSDKRFEKSAYNFITEYLNEKFQEKIAEIAKSNYNILQNFCNILRKYIKINGILIGCSTNTYEIDNSDSWYFINMYDYEYNNKSKNSIIDDYDYISNSFTDFFKELRLSIQDNGDGYFWFDIFDKNKSLKRFKYQINIMSKLTDKDIKDALKKVHII